MRPTSSRSGASSSLGLTIFESYAALFKADWAGFGQEAWLGCLEDTFAALVLLGVVTFAVIRVDRDPHRLGRKSRFFGSHTGAAWLVLFLISMVVVTLVVYRGAQINTGHFPYTDPSPKYSYFSYGVSKILGTGSYNHWVETLFILLQLGVVLSFLCWSSTSKHLQHLPGAPERHVLPAPRRARRAAANDLGRQADQLRGPG